VKVQEKNITKTKTKRLISESLRSSSSHHQQQPYTLTPEQQPQYE
jgi:hypothetical protein